MAVQQVQPEKITRLWEQVLLSVNSRLESRQAFDTWFKPIVPREITPEIVELEVPNTFFVDWIHEHHLSTLRSSLTDVLSAEPEIRFCPREIPHASESSAPSLPPAADAPSPGARVANETKLIPRLTFESFVVGGSNRFTHAACQAVAQSPGDVYNPLFIFGGSGLGKIDRDLFRQPCAPEWLG